MNQYLHSTAWVGKITFEPAVHPEGVRFYTKLKTITSRWPSGSVTDPEFTMPTMK